MMSHHNATEIVYRGHQIDHDKSNPERITCTCGARWNLRYGVTLYRVHVQANILRLMEA